MRDVLRGAWCVIRMIVVGAALSACSNLVALPTTQPGSTPSVAVSQTPTPLSIQPTPPLMGADCAGDHEPPVVASGWQLLWQHTFDNPIALPPITEGSQLALLERAKPFPKENIDTLWIMEPDSGTILWKYSGIDDFVHESAVSHLIRRIAYSERYLALQMQYLTTPFEPVRDYIVVVDRSTGRTIYHGVVSSEKEIAVSNDALYYRGADRVLYRIDLPAGTTRWRSPSGKVAEGTVLFVEPWLYAVTSQREIDQYDPIDGRVVEIVALRGQPQTVQIIQGQIALIQTAYGFEGISAFDLRKLAPQWDAEVSYIGLGYGLEIPSFVASDTSAFLFDASSALLRLDLKNGQEVWRNVSINIQPLSRPMIVTDLVYGFFVDGTLRAFSVSDGAQVAIVARLPIWNSRNPDLPERDVLGGLGVSDDTLIVTTGCRSVYAIQRAP